MDAVVGDRRAATKTAPAQLMAAVSPTCDGGHPVGPMVVGIQGEVPGLAPIAGDCENRASELRRDRDRGRQRARLAPSVRHLMGDGPPLDHACVTEALGLSLPMSATIPAPHAERFARRGERQGCGQLGRPGGRAQRLRTPAAFQKCASGCCRRLADRPTAHHLTAIANRTHIGLISKPRQVGPRGAGADRPPTVGRALHGALPSCRGVAEIDGELGDLIYLDAGRSKARRCRCPWPAPREVPGQDASARGKIRSSRRRMAVLPRQSCPRGAVINHSPRASNYCNIPAVRVFTPSRHDARVDDPALWSDRRGRAGLRNAVPRAPGHAGGVPADPDEASRAAGRKRHGADFGCAMSGTAFGTIVLQHHAGIRRGWSAGAGEERRHDPARRCRATHRSDWLMPPSLKAPRGAGSDRDDRNGPARLCASVPMRRSCRRRRLRFDFMRSKGPSLERMNALAITSSCCWRISSLWNRNWSVRMQSRWPLARRQAAARSA